MTAIDLFAGVGGWDLAAREFGIDPLGIEIDEAACATRDAAGLRTLRADLLTLKPFGPCDLLLASPPCQHFSASAPRRRVVSNKPYNIKRRNRWRAYSDQGPQLLRVPMEWASVTRPSRIAFEQVPNVLPTWQEYARELEGDGYFTWPGVLNVSDYGVPQDRPRAILLASTAAPVAPPQPHPWRGAVLHPTIVCNRRSKGGIVLGRSLKQGGKAIPFSEAGAIQGFPLNYPWQGGVEAKSRQIGNPIPPPFATALIGAALKGA